MKSYHFSLQEIKAILELEEDQSEEKFCSALNRKRREIQEKLNAFEYTLKQMNNESTDESTALDSKGYGYSYLWWLREEGGTFVYSALGDGGNVICCIPGKDIVVAIASKIISKPLDRWTLFDKCIIPAVIE